MKILNRIMAKLAVQRNMSPHIGALITAYSSTAILYAPLTLVGVATTIYGLWGANIIRSWFPWFTLGHLLGLMVLFLLSAMVMFHKVVIPSLYAYQMRQQYKHKNPLVADMQVVIKSLMEVNISLKQINARLDKLEGKGK